MINFTPNSKYFEMNRIKEVLEERELTQMWLSKQLGKSYNMINSYVQNRRQPSIKNLFRIAKLLDIETRDLIKLRKEVE